MRLEIGQRVRVYPYDAMSKGLPARTGTVRGSFASVLEGIRYWVRFDDGLARCYAIPARLVAPYSDECPFCQPGESCTHAR